VGAGALPVGEHRRRPPIPIVPADAPAREAARARGATPAAVWAAGVTGADPARVHARAFVACPPNAVPAGGWGAGLDVVVVERSLAPDRDSTREAAMSVGEVALAVDAGRELAAQAAAGGITVVAIASSDDRDATAAQALAGALAGAAQPPAGAAAGAALALHARHVTGPLGALRRLGTPVIAVLCGVALGAGERGLGCVCEGLAASAAAAVAAGIEPDLGARLIAARPLRDPAYGALAALAGLAAILGEEDAGTEDASAEDVGHAVAAAMAALRADARPADA
jgi:nicotinate-nucleotide--dimethylbenzimidazole phosphoribosyltransferase